MRYSCVECNGVLTFETSDDLESHIGMMHAYLSKDRQREALGAGLPTVTARQVLRVASQHRPQKLNVEDAGRTRDTKEGEMPAGSTPMAQRTCGACGAKGHRRDHCPSRKEATAVTTTICERCDSAGTPSFSYPGDAVHPHNDD